MKPALSPQEWATGTDMDFDYALHHGRRHGIAARLLYGQPFGFTREDVKLLRDPWHVPYSDTDEPNDPLPDFRGLADRIEALLPPEAV